MNNSIEKTSLDSKKMPEFTIEQQAAFDQDWPNALKIAKMLHRFYRGSRFLFDLDDYISLAGLCFVKAVRAYRPERGDLLGLFRTIMKDETDRENRDQNRKRRHCRGVVATQNLENLCQDTKTPQPCHLVDLIDELDFLKELEGSNEWKQNWAITASYLSESKNQRQLGLEENLTKTTICNKIKKTLDKIKKKIIK